jgi:uncharacterized repeat protein (TIGR03806 family)
MKNTLLRIAPLALLPALLYLTLGTGAPQGLRGGDKKASSSDRADRSFGLKKGTSWTTSHITGSPEPPHPYRIERVFPKLTFRNPLLMTVAPGLDRFFVGEHYGKLYSFPNDPNCTKADLFLDLTTEIHSWDKDGKVKGVGAVYSLVFHPQFQKNRYCYICYILDSKNNGEQLPDGSRISRFSVTDTDPPRVDPKSEKVVISWLAGGHNGCDLHFGPDGFLYISTGDGSGPNPPDARNTGQDISDLLSSILRIDVDREEKGKAYAVPQDNPFVDTPNARPEIWCYGLRNPWRMSFDRQTGDLWVGDVGWELWEMIYRIKKGGNYGWSIMEGRQSVHPEGKRGPTPILPPTFDFPHTEAASITCGYVYRGKKLKDLVGTFICGDWVTRKLWGTRFDGDKVVSHRELAQGNQRIVSFCQDHEGELYFVNYDEVGTLHRIVPNEEASKPRTDFPRKLSETGLFTSVKDHKPAPGVVPFDVIAEQWADHAASERFVAVPGGKPIRMYDSPIQLPGAFFSGQVYFPPDGVLARTISMEMERGNPRSRRRLETQVLHFDGETCHGYTYRWNDDQTDAVLVPSGGEDTVLDIIDAKAPGSKRRQTWHYPSRAECMTCHNPWTGHTIAFTLAQLNREHDYDGVTDNQLRAMRHAGLVELLHRDDETEQTSPLQELPAFRLTDPRDGKADLDARARSYLQVNCAHCHQFGAGGSAEIELRATVPIDRTKTLEVRPVQGTFGIAGAQLLAPGDPDRSVLYYRMSKTGGGRMPHIGSELVDDDGVRLMHDWIRQLPVHKDERALLEQLRSLDEPAALAREDAERVRQLRWQSQEIARQNGREKPSSDDLAAAQEVLKLRAAEGVKRRQTERKEVIRQMLSATSTALLLSRALAEDRVPQSIRPQILSAALASPEVQVRDLFERFVPDDKRIKRLGSVIKPETILALKGNAERGRELFFKSATLQCINCHRVQGTGATLGPDLSDIARKNTRAQILESILEPSKQIDPKYQTYMVETTDGKFHTGLLGEKTDKEVVLRMAGDKETRIPAAKVVSLTPQKVSIMPELLLRDVTAEQAADLLEFLAGLK